jgi:hypothetical protein
MLALMFGELAIAVMLVLIVAVMFLALRVIQVVAQLNIIRLVEIQPVDAK